MPSKRNVLVTTIIGCFTPFWLAAQNITVFFPQFTGKEYVFVLNQGAKRDTIQSGIVGETGFATVELAIPERYKGYVGVGSWSISDGRGINFIINGGNFSITCPDSVPNVNNTVYEGSEENDRMNRYEYGHAGEKPAVDTSYAAFLHRTLNYIRKRDKSITEYLAGEVNIDRLYTSGLWTAALTLSFQSSEDNKTAWGENMLKMLKRAKPQDVFDSLASKLILLCEQYGWNDAEQIIIASLESSQRLPADPANIVNRAIAQTKIKIGDKAPALNGEIPTNALLLFYETGCAHCQRQLSEITQLYPKLTAKGIRVISISVDESEEVYEYHSKDFPWQDKLCDFKGYKGENVRNYGIVGTPTIYLIDENGVISDRQPWIEDIKALKPD
jgi:peroxiredoxin